MENIINAGQIADVAKVSLKDQIAAATADNYKDVLQEIVNTGDQISMDINASSLAKILGVNKGAILKELKTVESNNIVIGLAEPEMKATFPGLVDIVQDANGAIRYLIKADGELRLADTWEDHSGNSYCPPDAKLINFLLPNAERSMKMFVEDEDHQLYKDLIEFFKRFSYLEDDVWPIIVLSVFLSYIQDHADVRYLPVIYFYAVAERGKSKTAKTMLATSYRGLHLVDIRPANIFRFAENWNATLFFDVTDLWRSAEKGDGQDILLGRFEKGTQIARVLNSDRGPFADQTFFDIYGSTIVATNEPANITFESRCLSISMPNKPGDYENLAPSMALPLKDRLTAFRARLMDKHLPQVEAIPGISGRLWEISKPLFQLARLVSPEAFEQMKSVILEMAGQKVEDKKETIEGRLVAAIDCLADFDGNLPTEIMVESIRKKLNEGKQERFWISPQKLGKRIQSLSIKTKVVNGYSRAIVTASQLHILKEQYGLIKPAIVEETLPLTTTAIPAESPICGHGDLVENETDKSTPTSGEIKEKHPQLRVVESSRESQGDETPVKNKPKVSWKNPSDAPVSKNKVTWVTK